MAPNPNKRGGRSNDVTARRNSADLHRDTGVYALHALDDDERARFERHLHHCRPCGEEVASFQRTISRLSIDVRLSAPPGIRTQLERVTTVRTRKLFRWVQSNGS